MKRKKLTLSLKTHGGKAYLADDIIALMPPRCKNPNAPSPKDKGWLHYVEPYFGGGAVLLAQDPEGISEVANDLDGDLINFWLVLGAEELFLKFQRIVATVPFSQPEWAGANIDIGSPVERAVAFFVRCRQSLSGRKDAFASVTRNRTRRGMNEQVSAWLNAIEGLPAVHERLKRVLILRDRALDVIRKQDGLRTLFYLDPPYLHETRAGDKEYGEFELAEADHAELLGVLASIEGRFLLSGYRSEMYDEAANKNGWQRHEFGVANHAAGGKKKRVMVECVWTNYDARQQ